MADGFHKLAPATGVGLALLGLSEVAHARAAGKPIPPCDRSAVVVLGFPNRRNGGIHPVQRWRVRLALQTFAAHNGARLVFTGGETRGTKSEAETMADEAVAQGANRAQIVIEGRATSTWENVYLTMPLVKDFDTVILVSDPIHAARAKPVSYTHLTLPTTPYV